MSAAQHTPGPLPQHGEFCLLGIKVERDTDGSFIVHAPPRWLVVNPGDDAEENYVGELCAVLEWLWAAHPRIVQCVNAHDELVAALDDAVRLIASLGGNPKFQRAAIAKATGRRTR